MINSIGLPNKGLRGYLAEDLPRLAELPVPLIVNVMGSTPDEVAALVAAFGEREEVAALELNVSCPNVKTGLLMGADPGETAALLDVVRSRTAKPLIVKLTPNCASPAAVAAAAEQHGADAVSLVNTLRGMAIAPAPAAASRGSAAAPAACRARPSARSRSRRCARSASASGCRSSAWAACRAAATPATCSTPARISSASGPRSFRDPRAGARIAAELEQIDANSGIIGRLTEPSARAYSTSATEKALQSRRVTVKCPPCGCTST